MDDLAESLWSAFAAESEEHLAAAEPLIAAAESEAPSADEIAQLFRDFHSLKGLARGLGMTAMEAVAHHAESLLGLVRAGTLVLTAESVGALLEAIDVLRALRALAVEQRRDGEAPAPLLARLQALAVAPGTAETPLAVASPTADRSPWLDIDPDMCRYFAELLRDDLGELGHRLPQLAAGGAVDEANVGRMRDILAELEHAAGAIDLHAFATLCRGLANVLLPGMEWTVFHLLTRLDDFLAGFEGETGLDAGGASFRADLRDVLTRFATFGRERLAAALRALADEPPMLGAAAPQRYDAVASAAGDLARALAMFPDLADRARPAFLVQDVFGRARLGDFVPSPATVAAAAELAASMAEDAPSSQDSCAPFLAAALADMDGDCSAEFVRSFLRKHKIGEDLLSSLSPEACAEAARLMANGWEHAFVIEARLEASPEVRERFLRWLETDVRPITNKATQQGGETFYRFLLLSRDAVEQVKARLGEIDGGSRRLIRLAEPAGGVKPDTPAPGAAAPSGTVIRVTSEVIDRFMAHIGELLLARSSIHMTLAESGVETALARLHKAASTMAGEAGDEVSAALRIVVDSFAQLSRGDQHLHGVLKRLQESALELRVVPIDTVFNRFPRVVRDIAQRTGKSVRLELAGREVRIDKGMVEQLVDPLTHMVRNAIDHGIETAEERAAAGKPPTGVIRLSASQRGNRVLIEIADDGKGLVRDRILAKAVAQGLVTTEAAATMNDEDAFALIFMPGFSTNETVTETSGRGVGMDVVNVNVSRVGGRVAIRSVPGQGTTFTLSLPLSAAIQDVLLVDSGGQVFAIPERFLLEICETEPQGFETVRGQRAMMLRRSYLPVFALSTLLGLPAAVSAEGRARTVLIIGSGASRMGLEVDRVARRQELYVKDIHARLLSIPGIGGASVLGDGRAVIILDVEGLFRLAAGCRTNQQPVALAAE